LFSLSANCNQGEIGNVLSRQQMLLLPGPATAGATRSTQKGDWFDVEWEIEEGRRYHQRHRPSWL